MKKAKSEGRRPSMIIDSGVVRQIRQHARSCNKTEVCGVLIGREGENTTIVEASIAGLKAAQAGTHVTFTQDTWEHIYQTKDKQYPDHRIVGWYHSHPGFGVFLSDHDTFIHKNFFSSPQQVAWVYDPHSDEEGCFGWVGERLERLSQVIVADEKGGEEAGETGKPEPVGVDESDEMNEVGLSLEQGHVEPPSWLRWTVTVMSHISVLVLGFAVSWFLFPRVELLPIPIDMMTGRPMWQYVPDSIRDQLGVDWPTAGMRPAPGTNGDKSLPGTPNSDGKAK
jgi:proteasome lid subunit RPN8/RPN11